MRNHLTHIIEKITTDHADNIDDVSRHYLEVSIAEKAAQLGLTEARECYKNVNAIVPLKSPVEGMKVRIDGRTFVNYVQFASGIAVPNYVARQTDLPHRAYVPQDSMILNFT
ncbi:MAG: hypothetical protein QNK29_16210 [Desulfobacterales bacterium]|nr:hypothetical protein [Desulfobacterales bacterium]MDX2513518.1 hypothetical protein [Desulfobacterales bacterium]